LKLLVSESSSGITPGDVKRRNEDRDDPDVFGGREDADPQDDEEDASTQTSDANYKDDEDRGCSESNTHANRLSPLPTT
jgi:hypothetical protein